ncbi:MAG: phenylacetate-CoA oxygenase subunit PaaJ [Acidimicrobiia bacterium]|jgi:ring-1,2-phenylacetyl-CoA epoxidase subunit PaaD
MVSVATDLRTVVASVVDPEIPVLTIEDLGILRSVETVDDRVVVTITPTYSGCPAMRQITDDIVAALSRVGVEEVEVKVTHSPAWTTEWISEEGRRKLEEFGIAPPTSLEEVLCPRCQGDKPRMVARFGSTACKALMVCSSCGEPFDYFKEF